MYSMQKEVVERLRKRAGGFIDAAAERFKAGDYDLACFMAEQAVQLISSQQFLNLVEKFQERIR